ncbi:MAG: hypothetical protein ACI9LM_003130 [Alteromonadaceae bacterium]|jgi:hypothetical protein
MQLINYLNAHFHTEYTLLKLSNTSAEELLNLQTQQLMPTCSYQLNQSVTCHSFFGGYDAQKHTQYYAKGYVEWLKIIKNSSPENAFSIFLKRYQKQLNQLKTQGLSCEDDKLNNKLNDHIKSEWQHFLNGTYGLCTRSGLPEDIANKELAILEINRLISLDPLSTEQLQKLNEVVNLLDKSSALFAPHERIKSSRYRLIDQVREKYQLFI